MTTKRYGVMLRIKESEHEALKEIKEREQLVSISAAINFLLKENAALKVQLKK